MHKAQDPLLEQVNNQVQASIIDAMQRGIPNEKQYENKFRP